jgi:hypothetical protein
VETLLLAMAAAARARVSVTRGEDEAERCRGGEVGMGQEGDGELRRENINRFASGGVTWPGYL